ncbi:MAG TPA: protein kinase, partial [Polyangiaceae bacterium]|nr:protein kinase [Polyangiaceae bacterium]
HTMLPMGTPGYMSPEQIRDCGGVDARTDIWALGCVLSELITGTSAFQAPTVPQLTATILERDPIPLRKLMPEAPPGLEALILKCLEKDPDRRFQDVAELAVALYPFGPRRSRVSAERCHHVLKGQQGSVIEFGSVAPPPLGASTPLPVSSTGPVVSAIPESFASPEPVRTSTPATITMAASRPPKTNRHIVTIAAAAVVTAALGAVLGFRSVSAPGAPASGAPVVGAAAGPTPRMPVAAPAVALTGASAASPPASAAAQEVASEAPLVIEAPAFKSSQAKRAAKAKTARPAPVAPKPAPVAAKPAPAASKRRATLDDSEPDVGY